jgi:hypothetical protein
MTVRDGTGRTGPGREEHTPPEVGHVDRNESPGFRTHPSMGVHTPRSGHSLTPSGSRKRSSGSSTAERRGRARARTGGRLAGRGVGRGRNEGREGVGPRPGVGNVPASPSDAHDRAMADRRRDRCHRPDPNHRVVDNVVRQDFQDRAANGRRAERREDVRYKQGEREQSIRPGVKRA